MDKKEKEKYLKILFKEKEVIFKNLGHFHTVQKEGDKTLSSRPANVPTHLAELGTDIFEKELELDLVSLESERLREINEAIAKLEKGNYGICEKCGQKISRSRLVALPYAKYCIVCQKEEEKTEP